MLMQYVFHYIFHGKIDLKSALTKLGEMGVNNLLLEAGSGLNGAMLEACLVD